MYILFTNCELPVSHLLLSVYGGVALVTQRADAANALITAPHSDCYNYCHNMLQSL